jgi:hypothetical protein
VAGSSPTRTGSAARVVDPEQKLFASMDPYSISDPDHNQVCCQLTTTVLINKYLQIKMIAVNLLQNFADLEDQ